MRRLLSLMTAAVLASLLGVGAQAAGGAELVRTFVYEDTLYTYVEMDGAGQPITKAEARIGTQTFPASNQLETVRQAGSPVTYLLLVDNSTSMPVFRQEIGMFGTVLARAGGENTRYILATFGDDFNLVGEDVPTGELAEQLSAIPFDERVTRLHTSMDHALDYLESLPREGNELRTMVVLSDAVQYDPTGGVPYETLLERLRQSDVMLHSIGFGDDAASLESLGNLVGASGGVHQVIGETDAESAAVTLSDALGGLFVTGFDISGCTSSGEDQEISITFSSGAELVCRAETTVDIPAPEEDAAEPDPPPAVSPPVTAAAPSAAAEPEQKAGVPVTAILAGAAVLAAAAVAAVLLAGKKRKPVPETSAPPETPGVYLRLEVLQGELSGPRTEFQLTEEQLIGRDGGCGIAFNSSSVSRRHVRVFLSDDAVCLEDLGSQNGTMVNGVPVQGPHILRSGDEITVGDAVFRLKF